uniref:Huntingtin-interacting protein 1-related protein n=1 Tax=Scleropages formosus TaxID=113540 RepID=A0A8C9W1T3_SCLFO
QSNFQRTLRSVISPLLRTLGWVRGLALTACVLVSFTQAVSINKAINTQEVAVKEKHARNILFFRGAHTFWAAVNRLPLSSNAVLCWKFCHVFHKLLRDGHPNVIKDSLRNKADLNDMSRMWGHMSEGYGKLCSLYLKLLITKMDFHVKNPRFPGNLQMSDRQLDEAGENDVNNFFQITVEMFDYLECELNLFLGVFSSLDMSRSVSVTAAGQCRLAPLLQVILDCSHLYDYTVKLLFKLHSCLPADTLEGHRDRFQEQFKKLKNLFYRSSNLQYFKRLIQIPQLPENAPNFLRASALSEHISPVVVVPPEPASPESEPDEKLLSASSQRVAETKFDDVFGATAASDPFNFSRQNGMRRDNKEQLVEQLTAELRSLKEELTTFRGESSRLCRSLQGRVSELEAELAEQSHLKRQALGESEFLRAELEDLRRAREDTEKEQRSLTEFERKAQANEQRYTKLKEKYTELVQGHAELLRKNAEVTRQVSVARAAQEEVELVRREMREKVKAAREEAKQRVREPDVQLISQTGRSNRMRAECVVGARKKCCRQLVRTVRPEVTWILAPCLRERERENRIVPKLKSRSSVPATPSTAARQRPFVDSRADVLEMVRSVVRFGHLVGDTVAQGGAASRTSPTEQAGRKYARGAGGEGGATFPECSFVCGAKRCLQLVKLRPRGLELQQGELGDLVEQEMAATSVTVETAAARIEEMLSASRAVDTGMKMEVNERILSSCTGLMQAVRELILSSKDLQRDILECGRGAATAKEFYAKNSRWTEGLISASKAVGWGAAVMVDAAEEALRGRGGFERLMVSSREIAAGTAQLVAASKVKADRDSANLARLQRASRGVTQAAAGVVASTKSAKTQIEERDTMDFSSMTLIQVKRQEMDSQVRVLELEAQLQRERERLGELRKKHYELAGVAEGWEEGEGQSPLPR